MAIKGKGKTRGRKAPAPAPRPVLVVRKPPLFRRTWFLGTLAGVVVALVLVLVLQGVRASHHRAFLERQRDAVSLFSDTISSHLPQENQSIGQGTIFLFPQLVQELDNLSGGSTKPADSLATEQTWAADAQKAGAAVKAVNVTKTIPADLTIGISGRDASGLTNATASEAQFLIEQAMAEYQSAFAIWAQAAAPGTAKADVKSLVDTAKTIGAQADALFSRGWGLVAQLRGAVGLDPVTQFPTAPPSPTPSVTASPSPSSTAAPTPTASPTGSASP